MNLADPQRGGLLSKTYEGGAPGPSYTYTPDGRLRTRTWARGLVTTYSYNNAGDMSGIAYSDGTPGVPCGCDRLGRKNSVTAADTVTTLNYNDAGQLLSESYSSGPLGGVSITNAYDSLLRRTNLLARQSGNLLIEIPWVAWRWESLAPHRGTIKNRPVWRPNDPQRGQCNLHPRGAQREAK